MATLNRTSGSFNGPSPVASRRDVGQGGRRRGERPSALSEILGPSSGRGHVDPGPVLVRAGDGGGDERHAGDAVGDAGVLEGGRDRLAATGADGPFEGPVQVGQ